MSSVFLPVQPVVGFYPPYLPLKVMTPICGPPVTNDAASNTIKGNEMGMKGLLLGTRVFYFKYYRCSSDVLRSGDMSMLCTVLKNNSIL